MSTVGGAGGGSPDEASHVSSLTATDTAAASTVTKADVDGLKDELKNELGVVRGQLSQLTKLFVKKFGEMEVVEEEKSTGSNRSSVGEGAGGGRSSLF